MYYKDIVIYSYICIFKGLLSHMLCAFGWAWQICYFFKQNITIILNVLKNEIVKEMKDTGVFSVQWTLTKIFLPTISVLLSFGDRAKKRLIRLVNVDNSSEKCLHTLLQSSLGEIGLTQEQYIGDSFDGAAI